MKKDKRKKTEWSCNNVDVSFLKTSLILRLLLSTFSTSLASYVVLALMFF